MCPPHSPTRITKKSILKLPGRCHCPKTSRIRFCAFSYSIGEPCGRSNQLITYFIPILPERGKSSCTKGTARFLVERITTNDHRPTPVNGQGDTKEGRRGGI